MRGVRHMGDSPTPFGRFGGEDVQKRARQARSSFLNEQVKKMGQSSRREKPRRPGPAHALLLKRARIFLGRQKTISLMFVWLDVVWPFYLRISEDDSVIRML